MSSAAHVYDPRVVDMAAAMGVDPATVQQAAVEEFLDLTPDDQCIAVERVLKEAKARRTLEAHPLFQLLNGGRRRG